MSNTIYLVRGDSGPELNLTLKDSSSGDRSDPDTWEAIDLSAGTTTVSVKFRKKGTTVLIASIPCFKTGDGSDGKVFMPWPAGVLDNDAGTYEGEIEIDYDGAAQTVYDKLKFKLREEF